MRSPEVLIAPRMAWDDRDRRAGWERENGGSCPADPPSASQAAADLALRVRSKDRNE